MLGEGAEGLLGNGTTTQSSVPVLVTGITGATDLSVGSFTACTTMYSGVMVLCWGSNEGGQLGSGSFSARVRHQRPARSPGSSSYHHSLTAGESTSCAIEVPNPAFLVRCRGVLGQQLRR